MTCLSFLTMKFISIAIKHVSKPANRLTARVFDAASKNLVKLENSCWKVQLNSSKNGIIKPIRMGVKQNMNARKFFAPVNRILLSLLRSSPIMSFTFARDALSR